MDSSKVIHTRIPMTVLAGVVDALEVVAEKNVNGRALSSMVATTLEGFINTMIRQGHIREYTLDEAYHRLQPWLTDNSKIDFGIDVALTMPSPPAMPPPVAQAVEAPTEELAEPPPVVSQAEVMDALSKVRDDPFDAVPLEESTSVTIPERKRIKATRKALQSSERLRIGELASQVVRGEAFNLIKEAMETVNGDMILAIETVYTALSSNRWNSDLAKDMIYQIMEDLADDK